jgi:hypothetical protein
MLPKNIYRVIYHVWKYQGIKFVEKRPVLDSLEKKYQKNLEKLKIVVDLKITGSAQ